MLVLKEPIGQHRHDMSQGAADEIILVVRINRINFIVEVEELFLCQVS